MLLAPIDHASSAGRRLAQHTIQECEKVMPAVYYTDIDEFMDLPGLALLPAARRDRAERLLRPADKARCVAAGLLLRRWIGPVEPCTGPHGKPFVPGSPGFSLSHSGRYVVLAVASGEVGADIEEVRPRPSAVAERCFSAAELRWLDAAADPVRAFYTLWTAKESIMKASGAGFAMPIRHVTVDPEASCGIDAAGIRFSLSWLTLDGHIVCTASDRPALFWALHRCTCAELLGT